MTLKYHYVFDNDLTR